MNLLRPRFHDPAFRPDLRTQVALHWDANLRMLRRPLDVVLFTVISMLPVGGLVALDAGLPEGLVGLVTDRADGTGTMVLRSLAIAAVFLPLQHVAFMVAMDLTYIPHVRAAMQARGVPVCRRCGSLLPPETPDAACSECGHPGSSATIRDSGRAGAKDASPANPDTEVPRR